MEFESWQLNFFPFPEQLFLCPSQDYVCSVALGRGSEAMAGW